MRRAQPARPRSRLRGLLDWALVAALFGLCALLVVRLEQVALRSVSGTARVIDGDTLEVAGGRVRLSGIDAFEREQSCRRDGADYACGAEAARELGALVRGGGVECAGRTVDRYGRLLGLCTAGARNINGEMVASGWALAWGGYEAEERAARSAGRGAWAGEFAAPADWRAGRGGAYEPRQDWLRRAIDLIVQIFAGREEFRDEAL